MPSLEYTAILCGWIAGLFASGVWLVRLRRARRRARKPLRLVHALLAAVLVLAALTLPELVFALAYDATDSFSQTNVSRRWFARHVQPNRAGFRDDQELPSARERGVTYIGFVGDSFTFGHGIRRVENRFSDIVAAGLNEEFPHRTRVFNAALQGMDIRALTNSLAPELINTTPLDILVYVFVPNDIEYLDERTARFYAAQQSSAPKFFLWRDTYFYNWLYYRLRNVFAAGREDYYGYLADAYTGEPWPEFTRKLNQLHAYCERHHVELRVVVFPFLNTLGDHDPFGAAYERVIGYCREQEVPCLDLRPVLLPHQPEGLTVSRFDAHPNERAHQLAAEAILRDLSQELEKHRAE